MRISLITTGEMEFRGLAAALVRLFPEHVFHSEPDTPGRPFNGFTSRRVQPLLATDPSGYAGRMVRAALDAVCPPNATKPAAADFAYIIDDLEIVNKANEAVVIDHMRESANRVLRGLAPMGNPTRVAKALRERIRFFAIYEHLSVYTRWGSPS